MKRLSEKLTLARQHRFVGRRMELQLFRAALTAEVPPFVALHIYGPGGVGKTALLHQLERLAAEHGRSVVRVDGRNIEPSPGAFEAAARLALDAPTRTVLLVDTYELLAPLDSWLRDAFLAKLPADALVVIAGRHAPTDWLSDSGWSHVTQVIVLGNLQPDECRAFLTARGVPAQRHAAALAFTHGHPLALSLIAELHQQNPQQAQPLVRDERDILHVLLQRFVQHAPTDQHQLALELCAIARVTTEDLLANHFDATTAHTLFAWLRGLSFIEHGPHGLFPHDLVREALTSDLHWRNPTRYAALQEVVLNHLRRAGERGDQLERQRLRIDMIFVNRRAPGMQSFFAWEVADTAYAEPAKPSDFPAILEMVQRHEGTQSADIARYWQARQPEAFLAYRTSDGQLYGFMTQLALHTVVGADEAVDPALSPALRFVQTERRIRSGDAISHMRFWMAYDTYQAVSPAINITAANCVIHWTTTPRLVFSFVTMSAPDFMAPHFESIRFWRTPAADFTVSGRAYGVFSHNWVADPVSAWLRDTKHADTGMSDDAAAKTGAAKLQDMEPDVSIGAADIVLTPAEFAAAVRQALRDYTRMDALSASPLLHTRLLAGHERTAAALQVVLRQAIDHLKHNPKDAKLYRALWFTYVEPQASQEKAAERLDLPFNTYRYHLSNGFERLTAALWRQT